MERRGKAILGFASAVVLTAVTIGLSVHFTRKAKNETSLAESLSNTTVTSATHTSNSIVMTTIINSTTSTKDNTMISASSGTTTNAAVIVRNNATTSANTSPMINTITNALISAPIVATVNTSTDITSVPSSVTLGAVSVQNVNITSFNSANNTSPTIAAITSNSLISSTYANVYTSMTSNSAELVCLIDFKPMVSYFTDNDLGANTLVLGDFNNDSFPDIAVANYDNSSVGILLGKGDGTFLPERTFYTGNHAYPDSIAVGDVNNDRQLDVIIASGDTSMIAVLLGNGDGTLVAQKAISTGTDTYPYGVVVGYFDKDNILDIAIANSGTSKVGVFIGNGNGTFQSQKLLSTGSRSDPYGVALGDFNHDNYTDIASANSGTGKVGIFLGYGNGSFRSLMTFSAGSGASWVNAVDFNGDGHLDIAVLNAFKNNIGILTGYGNGSFSAQTTYPVGNLNETYTFTVADVNNDGQWDILVPNVVDSNIGILLGHGDGSFGAQITVSTGTASFPNEIDVADLDRDNRSDVVIVNTGSDEIGVLIRRC